VFADELVDAAARLVGSWAPDPVPAWVTCVPSTRRPALVADVAERLADALGLPFVPALTKVGANRSQREMDNSAQQVLNVHDAFALAGEVPSGPVLLVDDTVVSRWTLTVVGGLLREHGVEAVHPLVLAQRS
jgi:ATP-dependent DNA helicase RecQ